MARGRSLLVVSALVAGVFGAGALPAAAATFHDVSVSATAFSPATKTIEKGDTVVWTFTTAGQGLVWDAGTPAPSHAGCARATLGSCSDAGDVYKRIFSYTGTYTYSSAVDAGMTGTIVVKDTTAPAMASTLTGTVASGAVTLRWTATKPADFARFEVRRFKATATPSRTTGLEVYRGTGYTKTLTGLNTATTHKFAIWVVDKAGNASLARARNVTIVAPTSLTISRSASSVVYGRSVVVRGTLRAVNGAGESYRRSGQRVELRRRNAGSTTWSVIAARTSDSYGNVAFTVVPARHVDYRLAHVRTTYYGSSASSAVAVRVGVRLTGDVTSTFTGTGSPVAAYGAVTPAHSGARVYLQRKTSTGWSSVASSTLSSTGRYTINWSPPSSGAHALRVSFPSHSDHTGAVRALATVTSTSRTLRSGMTGSDVLALQRALARLHYDVGPINGRFGYDTLHAVVPFQKVNGMGRDGIVGPMVRARIGKPVQARMRETRSGGHVEVDLTKQVIMLGYHGKVYHVIDTSSGNNQPYTVDGQTYRATTPLGRFAITRKIDGMRISRLGELYRPAYFYQGWAIHGSKSVPSQPASHGCLRVTNPSQDRHFHRWTIGMPVWIFRS